MIHPKMRYTYVGIDSHKETHTAVFINCFFEKLGEISFANLPNEFGGFLENAQKFQLEGTTFIFGMEDCSSYGRTLARFLTGNGQHVKHVNGLLVARERKNQNIVQKSDSVDAECAARVLLSKFDSLPDAEPQDKYFILRSLVVRRKFLVRNRAATKHYLHSILTQSYPNYRKFFENIDCKTSLAFFMSYPSPNTLEGVTVEELAAFLEIPSNKCLGMPKAKEILESLQETAIPFQEIRDLVAQSAIRQLLFNIEEIEKIDGQISEFLKQFDCTLTTMAGIDTVTAAQMLSCIGDIKKFSTPAKLARYAGIAPVTYSSGKTDLQFANQRGNRELNSLFFWLAVQLSIPSGSTHKVMNSFLHDYFNRKISEGKTKSQALKCVQRRLINIVWSMLTHGEEYVNPPAYDLPKEEPLIKKKSQTTTYAKP
jgi:transposase